MPGMPEPPSDYYDLHEGDDINAPSGDFVGLSVQGHIQRNGIERPEAEVSAQDNADPTMTPADWDEWFGEAVPPAVIDPPAVVPNPDEILDDLADGALAGVDVPPIGHEQLEELWDEVVVAGARLFGGRAGDFEDVVLNGLDQFFAGWANKLTFGGSNKLRELVYGDIATQNHEGALYEAGEWVGVAHWVAFALASLPASGSAAAAESAPAGVVRAAQFGKNWPAASLRDALARHAGPNATRWATNTGKIIAENPTTGRQVVIDVAGKYFRIFQPNRFGGTSGRYLNLLGRIPAPVRQLKSRAYRPIQLGGDQLKAATHFLIRELL